MYAYRRMTPEQREQVVAERIAQGRPWHKLSHPDEPGWYLITAACYEHRLHFSLPNELRALETRLIEAVSEAGAGCGGWVVMPNHYHALLRIENMSNFGRAIGRVHGRSAFYTNQRDRTPGRQVWYKYADRKVRSERHDWTCLHYILMNPVKHRFVRNPQDWAWSSFHEILHQHGQEWIDDLRREYPLREFGKQWDDWHLETES